MIQRDAAHLSTFTPKFSLAPRTSRRLRVYLTTIAVREVTNGSTTMDCEGDRGAGRLKAATHGPPPPLPKNGEGLFEKDLSSRSRRRDAVRVPSTPSAVGLRAAQQTGRSVDAEAAEQRRLQAVRERLGQDDERRRTPATGNPGLGTSLAQ